MIPVGTPCWIIYAPAMPDKVGRACVVTKHGHFGVGEYGVQNCKILVDGEEVGAAFKCLVPINPPEQKRKAERREKETT